MKKYLMGSSNDLLRDGLYPLIAVDDITKEDLARCKDKHNEIVIINVYELTFFDAETNSWKPIKEFNNFNDQWKDDN